MKCAVVAFLAVLSGLSAVSAVPTYDVRSFGAAGDGSTKDTAALQRALDACAKTGGRVVVPPGNYLTGSVFLGDNTELHLQEGATLVGSPDLADYNADDAYPQNFCSPREGWSAKHLILAIERRNVSITGRGAIDGNGRVFLEEKPSRYGSICWRDGCCEVRGGRKNMGRPGQEIVFVECEGVTVRDVTFRDMSCWSCLFYGCSDVTVGGVTVRNNIRGFNTDGFDVDSCRNVRIGDCDITTGDDAIAIRGSPWKLKDKTKVCENVQISNIVCRVSSSGVRVGVGSGAIRNVRISDMNIERAGRGIHVQCCYVKAKGKVEVRGVDISDVAFERIKIRNAASALLVVAGYPSSRALLENIRFSDVDAESFASCFVAGNGTTRVKGVEFSDCAFRVVRTPGKAPPSDSEAGSLECDRSGAFRIQQADGVVFRRCSLAWNADANPELSKAFTLYDAPSPDVDAESSMNDRIGCFSCMAAACDVRDTISYIAHQGEEALAPNHSKPAYRLAVEHKLDYLKLDLRETKDGQVVLQHDATLKATMKWDVKIADHTLAEIRERGRYFSRGGYTNETIVTLQEALEIAKGMQKGVWFDFKHYTPEFAEKVFRIADEAGYRSDRIIVATFTKAALRWVQKNRPDVRCVAHTFIRKVDGGFKMNAGDDSKVYPSLDAVAKGLESHARDYGLYGFNLPHVFRKGRMLYHAPPSLVRRLHDSGYWISIWFAYEAGTAEYYREAGADALVTNCKARTFPDCIPEKKAQASLMRLLARTQLEIKDAGSKLGNEALYFCTWEPELAADAILKSGKQPVDSKGVIDILQSCLPPNP